MMRCPKCGKELEEGSNICSQCNGQPQYDTSPDLSSAAASEPELDAKKSSVKLIAIAAIVLVLLVSGMFAGHFLGLYTLPFLTDSVNAVKILQVSGTVEVERPPDTLAAREGMRLLNRRQGEDSADKEQQRGQPMVGRFRRQRYWQRH
jgi:hypothetical protein